MKKTILLFALLCTFSTLLQADEGMWLFETPPRKQVKERYGFELKDDWLNHVRLSTLRFAKRGTASFVSSQGLILTNHHVGARNLHELSTPEKNLLHDGFYAKTFDEELRCEGLEAIALVEIEDVTKKIEQAVHGKSDTEAAEARKVAFATIEQEAAARTGLRCEIITLFQGGVYHLYCYKVYSDIRLVWAPEESIASFGGDPDNYEYPRYCLDATMFRAYEDGKPARIEHFLRWCAGGVKEGELTFVSGFPGTTNRAFTREHLEYMRDVFFPHRLQKLYRREVVYSAYGNRNLENQRRIAGDLGVVQNYRKRALGQLDGLQTPSLWKDLPVASTLPENAPEARIARACEAATDFYPMYDFYEGGEAFNSRLFQIARTLVRIAQETKKPNEERIKEYRDGALETLKKSLFTETPVYEDVEILKLSDSLGMLREYDGGDAWNELIESLGLGPKSPRELARYLVRGTKLFQVDARKRFAETDLSAIDWEKDAMIMFASIVDRKSRELRDRYDKEMDAPIQAAYADLAKRRFEESGTDVYPDATFTLRLSYGAVRGYREDDGTETAPLTTIEGMYDRAESLRHKEPFDPPRSWKEGRAKLDPKTAFNFVTTNDIVGGNSGSPVVNAKAEVVGLAFDGNIYSLSNNFVYTETQSRCVNVHVDVILESLKKIYKADRLVEELGP